MGLVPRRRSMEKVGATRALALVMAMPIISCRTAAEGMVAGDPEMVGVLNADPAGTAGGCLFDGNLHGEGGYDEAQPAVAVDDCGGGCLVEDADSGAGVGPAGLLKPDIPKGVLRRENRFP
jgi:hypothetical protein